MQNIILNLVQTKMAKAIFSVISILFQKNTRTSRTSARILIFPLKENFEIAVEPADSSLEVRYSQFELQD